MPLPVSTDTPPFEQALRQVNSLTASVLPDSRPALRNPALEIDSILSSPPAAPHAPTNGVSIDAGAPTGVAVGKAQPSPSAALLPAPPWHTLKDVQRLAGGQSEGAYLCTFINHPPVVLKVGATSGAQALATALSPVVGVRAPLVRWVPSESTDIQPLQDALKHLSPPWADTPDVKHLSARIASSGKSVLLMEHLAGSTLGATGRHYPEQNDATTLLQTLGRLAAFDLIVGNQDRFENFDPFDCLGGGGLPANFYNILIMRQGMSANPVAAIDTCLSGDRQPGIERTVYAKRRAGSTRSKTTPLAIIAGVLAQPDTVSDYVWNNIVHMLEQVWFLPPNAGATIQQGMVIGLHQIAHQLTPARIESIRSTLGVDKQQVPIATLESRIDDLRELLSQATPLSTPFGA